MLNPAPKDLTLYYGGDFDINFVLYADARVLEWRGEWHQFFVYEEGDCVELVPGTAWVCLQRSMDAKPGELASAEFWSPLERMSLVGYKVELICDEIFTLTEGHGLTVEPETGAINVEAKSSQFATAPGSAHYYLKLTEIAGGTVTFPINGTMLFKQP